MSRDDVWISGLTNFDVSHPYLTSWLEWNVFLNECAHRCLERFDLRWAAQEMILNERRKVLAAPSIAAGRAKILATFLVRSSVWWYTLFVRDGILSDRMQETVSEWICSDDPWLMKSLNKLWSWTKSTDLHIFCAYVWRLHPSILRPSVATPGWPIDSAWSICKSTKLWIGECLLSSSCFSFA